jgi:23S rRNA (cytidine2498-2'-O)-methyltransferase
VTASESISQFVFAVCQRGAESVLKDEVARLHPTWRPAFSRAGFVTFKLPEGEVAATTGVDAAFARASGLCLGRATGETDVARAKSVWQLAHGHAIAAVHVFERDRAKVGEKGFEPGPTERSRSVALAIATAKPSKLPPTKLAAERGDLVLDCVLVDANDWWIGVHEVAERGSQYPGGVSPLVLPENAISRAWLKLREALDWAGFQLRPGDTWAEVGCAPGGASQALLELEQQVMGLDPANVDPRVEEHTHFVHIRKRGGDLKRREYQDVRFLAVDTNLTPRSTLRMVEEIVTHERVGIVGLLLTLKLPDWKYAEELPEFLERVKSWGFVDARARQLAHNRQEICLVAARDASVYGSRAVKKSTGRARSSSSKRRAARKR